MTQNCPRKSYLIAVPLFLFLSTFLFASPTRAVYCAPPITGQWNITEDCVLYEDVNGASLGDIEIGTEENPITLTLHGGKTLVWYPGQEIHIPEGSKIIINETAKIDQNYICLKESGTNSNYPSGRTAFDPRTGNPLYLGLDVINASTAAQLGDRTPDLTTGLLGWWKMDQATGYTADSSGNSLTLTNTGAGWNTGKIEQACTMAGSQNLRAPDNATLNNLTGNFTLAAWVNRTSPGNVQIISKTGAGGTGGFALLIGNAGEVYCRTDNGTTWTDSATNLEGWVTNGSGWKHVAVVKSGSTCKIFIDGIERASSIGDHSDVSTNQLPVTIGARADLGGENFAGSIDDARIYNRALTPTEIAELAGGHNPIAKFCPAGYKRREAMLTLDYVDFGTTGTPSFLASTYRYLLNLGFAISSINDGVKEVQAVGNVVRVLGDNLQICITDPCTLTPPAGFGNLIVENKVGVGIGDPTAGIHVADPASGPVAIFDTDTNSQNFYVTRLGNTNESLSIGVDDGSVYLTSDQDENAPGLGNMIFRTDNDGTANGYFGFQLKSGTDLVRLLSSGNFGIGTTTPGQKLEVAGNAKINNAFIGDVGHGASWAGFSHSSTAGTGNYALLQISDGSSTLVNAASGGNIQFRLNNTQQLMMNGTGLGIGNFTPAIDLAIGDTDTGFNWLSDGLLGIYSNNAYRALVTSSNLSFAGTGTGAGYNQGPSIELREKNFNGAQTGGSLEKPRIAFHWSGRVASQIGMDTAGAIEILNNPGNAYEKLRAGETFISKLNVGTTSLSSDQALNVYGNIRLNSGAGGSLGYVYSDGNQFGLLNNQGSWLLRTPNNGVNTYFAGTVIAGDFSCSNCINFSSIAYTNGRVTVGAASSNITMSNNAFFPNITHTGGGFSGVGLVESGEIGDEVARFWGYNQWGGGPHNMVARWRYITASRPPEIFAFFDPKTGLIDSVWAAEIEAPNQLPIEPTSPEDKKRYAEMIPVQATIFDKNLIKGIEGVDVEDVRKNYTFKRYEKASKLSDNDPLAKIRTERAQCLKDHPDHPSECVQYWTTEDLYFGELVPCPDCSAKWDKLLASYPKLPIEVQGSDIAEYYKTNPELNPGDIVIPDSNGPASVKKSQTEYDASVFGVVSTAPAQTIGDNSVGEIKVAIVGRVPVKVAGSSSAIKAGDRITSSNEPGKGMKANKSGQTIGIALEDWTPKSGKETVLISLNPTWFDPEPTISDTGDYLMSKVNKGAEMLSTLSNQVATKIVYYSEAIIAKLKVNMLEAQSISLNGNDLEIKIKELESEIKRLKGEIEELKNE